MVDLGELISIEYNVRIAVKRRPILDVKLRSHHIQALCSDGCIGVNLMRLGSLECQDQQHSGRVDTLQHGKWG